MTTHLTPSKLEALNLQSRVYPDAWIIEEELKREKDQRKKEKNGWQVPLHLPNPEEVEYREKHNHDDAEKNTNSVVIIPL